MVPPVAPDVPVPEKLSELAKGWLYNAYILNPKVDVACSSCVYHAFGQNDKTTTQGARQLYSTKLRALHALRHEVAKKCAEILAKIDQQIESEAKGNTDE